MPATSSRGRSPTRSPHAVNYTRGTPAKRSLSPRSESRHTGSRSPSYERPSDRRNGRHRPRSFSRSLSPSRPTSRSLSRTPSRDRNWSRDSRSHGNRDNGRTFSSPDSSPRSSKIVVEKLTKNITESHLREIFGGFGDIRSLDLPMNKAFMTNRGTAYILYHDPADAEAAIAHMHEAQLDGAVLNVSIVLPRRAFSHSPPPESVRAFSRHTSGRSQPFDSRARVSPYSRRSSPPQRRYGRTKATEKHDIYRPRSLSRSRSPRRSRSLSSGPPSPPPRRKSHSRMDSPPRRRRRSPSYSSYDYSSQSDRSRSSSRKRGDRYVSRRR
ncbi:RNA-binding domain-containing protein [Aspergillus steynii IBT 23096]|uniref:RNA-binding domain-containing protein n=1 Tax=Aspergillus steynii IBT 23096 TaxID=1392250 RepID=A0A2I2GCB3_9EURO|nr:RNA-binding domain-containing protein [Aspergillus steynii IBT 23096]PLB50519.1 RNA-binding domain-containing protein [Aspergillus steynii IBT 23096]